MTTRLILAPTVLAVTLDEAKAQLRIDGTDLDAVVTAWLTGVIDHAEHYMGRALMQQDWRVSLDCFPKVIKLRMPPVTQILSFKYIDKNGVEQTLTSSDYQFDDQSEPCHLLPAYGTDWPEARAQANAVSVTYRCGYGTDASKTPAGIRAYILAKLMEQFDPESRPEKDSVRASFLDRLLDRYTLREFG